jgi:hypothetical protein
MQAELSRSHPPLRLIASKSGFSCLRASTAMIISTPAEARPRHMMLEGMSMNLDNVPIVPNSIIVKISSKCAEFFSIPIKDPKCRISRHEKPADLYRLLNDACGTTCR